MLRFEPAMNVDSSSSTNIVHFYLLDSCLARHATALRTRLRTYWLLACYWWRRFNIIQLMNSRHRRFSIDYKYLEFLLWIFLLSRVSNFTNTLWRENVARGKSASLSDLFIFVWFYVLLSHIEKYTLHFVPDNRLFSIKKKYVFRT